MIENPHAPSATQSSYASISGRSVLWLLHTSATMSKPKPRNVTGEFETMRHSIRTPQPPDYAIIPPPHPSPHPSSLVTPIRTTPTPLASTPTGSRPRPSADAPLPVSVWHFGKGWTSATGTYAVMLHAPYAPSAGTLSL